MAFRAPATPVYFFCGHQPYGRRIRGPHPPPGPGLRLRAGADRQGKPHGSLAWPPAPRPKLAALFIDVEAQLFHFTLLSAYYDVLPATENGPPAVLPANLCSRRLGRFALILLAVGTYHSTGPNRLAASVAGHAPRIELPEDQPSAQAGRNQPNANKYRYQDGRDANRP